MMGRPAVREAPPVEAEALFSKLDPTEEFTIQAEIGRGHFGEVFKVRGTVQPACPPRLHTAALLRMMRGAARGLYGARGVGAGVGAGAGGIDRCLRRTGACEVEGRSVQL